MGTAAEGHGHSVACASWCCGVLCRRRGSRYQGVKRHHGVFQAGIYANGSFFNLGEFETEEAAARYGSAPERSAWLSWRLLTCACRVFTPSAYDKAALRYHRHSAKLNFPDEHVRAAAVRTPHNVVTWPCCGWYSVSRTRMSTTRCVRFVTPGAMSFVARRAIWCTTPTA